MGIAIENANAIVKVYAENIDTLYKALKQQSLKVSQIEWFQYKLTLLLSSSQSGHSTHPATAAVNPLDTAVTLRIDIREFPNDVARGHAPTPSKIVKFGMLKDKFLQFSRDMKDALAMLEATPIIGEQ